MNYDQACDKIMKLANQFNYYAVGISYNGRIKGPGRYVATAKNHQGIKVVIAYTGSYINMVYEAEKYLVDNIHA